SFNYYVVVGRGSIKRDPLSTNGEVDLNSKKVYAEPNIPFWAQFQERLTRQVAEAISPLLGGDVIVVAEASHMCMISRGIEKFGSYTSTIAVLGRFATDVT
ncbi:hypothetical protein S245_040394, partial [Arachis hypogaea]